MSDNLEPLSPAEIDALLRDATPPPWCISGISMNYGSISIGQEDYRIVIAYVTNAASLGDFVSSALQGRTDFGAPDTAKTQWANANLLANVHRLAATAKHYHDKAENGIWEMAERAAKLRERAEAAEAEIARLRKALEEATPEMIEAGCRAVYGRGWDGPLNKQPGEPMKDVWRNYAIKFWSAMARRALKGEEQ